MIQKGQFDVTGSPDSVGHHEGLVANIFTFQMVQRSLSVSLGTGDGATKCLPCNEAIRIFTYCALGIVFCVFACRILGSDMP